MKYHQIAKRLSNTFVSELPGIGIIHSIISTGVGWKHKWTAGEKWIEYNGIKFYADTSDHVAKDIVLKGEYEPTTAECIKNNLSKGDTAIDVGAHIGHHTVNMRQSAGSSGRILAVEPNPENMDYIKKTVQENEWSNIELIPVALSNTESSDQLIVSDSSNTGSAALRSVDSNSITSPDGFTVKTSRLTSILDDKSIDEIDLLKIDVEGAEIDIIADLAGHLSNINTIILEFHTQMIDEADVKEAFEILNDSGEMTDLTDNPVNLDRVLTEKVDIVWQSKI